MTDREALRSMLIYAQREAEALDLAAVAQLLSLAVADVDAPPADAKPLEARSFGTGPGLRAEMAGEGAFGGHFATRRLQ